MAPSQRGTACAVAVRAEGRIENPGYGVAVALPPDLPVRVGTPMRRAARAGIAAWPRVQGINARVLKERSEGWCTKGLGHCRRRCWRNLCIEAQWSIGIAELVTGHDRNGLYRRPAPH